MKTWRAWLRRITFWLVLAGAAAAALYFLVLKPIDVETTRVSKGSVVVEALGTGSVESRQTVDVGFEVTGRVVQIHVDQGDSVTKGQELATIDDRTFLAEVGLAEQEVALSEAIMKRLGADIERSKAVLKGAEDGLRRVRPQVAKGAASRESLDVADERHKVAVAELARSMAAQLEGQQAILVARRRLDRAKAALARTIVRSPFDGLVLRREREVGDVAVPGAAVLRLAATDTVWARVWVDETYLDALRLGLPARVSLRSDPERVHRGSVVRIGREVDRETRELLVEVAFEKLPDPIAFGQRVDLWIELTRRSDVVRIPARAILQIDGEEGVFVADADRAQFLALELGTRGREFIEVIGGLDSGDLVLGAAIGKNKLLKKGQRVRLAEAKRKETEQ
ncbi:MAG: efflux RND transporter periplasmic adaptor subunit [Planctomycetota bacterium]